MGKGPIIKGVLTNLTPAEKIYLVLHPHHVSIIRTDADKALAEAVRWFPNSVHNGDGDAFRHCFWSALLGRDIGQSNAIEFTTAHEGYSGNPAAERGMDLHNNAVGAKIGEANKLGDDAALSLACRNALTTGQLATTPRTPGQPY